MSNELYTFDKPDFEFIKRVAYSVLLTQKNPHIGMRAENVTLPGKKLIFDTIQDYAYITGASISSLTANGKISLGLHVNLSAKIYLLLHNDAIQSPSCENWTNYHEIGHICLDHSQNGDKEEVEAHFFAACFTMPDAVLRYFKLLGYTVDVPFLTKYFKVSREAAEKKINALNTSFYPTNLDNLVIGTLNNDIKFIKRDMSRRESSFINFSFNTF